MTASTGYQVQAQFTANKTSTHKDSGPSDASASITTAAAALTPKINYFNASAAVTKPAIIVEAVIENATEYQIWLNNSIKRKDSLSATVSHFYSFTADVNPGSYNTKLVVLNSGGKAESATKTVTVHDPSGVKFMRVTDLGDGYQMYVAKLYDDTFMGSVMKGEATSETLYFTQGYIDHLYEADRRYRTEPAIGQPAENEFIFLGKNNVDALISNGSLNITPGSEEYYVYWVAAAYHHNYVQQQQAFYVSIAVDVLSIIAMVVAGGLMIRQIRTLQAVELNSMHTAMNYAPSNSKINAFQTAEQANAELAAAGYSNPPYKPGTCTTTFELNGNSTYVRVFDNVHSKQFGQFIMRADDLAGLTPLQIQSKYALEHTPVYICDFEISSGSVLRSGITNANYGMNGGGIQIDLMGQYIGNPTNIRLLP